MEQQQSPQAYDVIALDAFSGDAIPAHLLTVEAFAVYLRHLKPTGVIAVHTSNRHLNLPPIVALIAQHYNMQVVSVYVEDAEGVGDSASEWLLVTNNEEFPADPCHRAKRRALSIRPIPPFACGRISTATCSRSSPSGEVEEPGGDGGEAAGRTANACDARGADTDLRLALSTPVRQSFAQLGLPLVQQLQCLERREAIDVRFPDRVEQRVFHGSEQGQLDVAARAFGAARTDLGTSLFVQMFGLQLSQDLLGTLVHAARHAGQPGHVNAVALVGRTGHDLVQEYDLVFPFLHGHVEIHDARQRAGQVGEFVVVRGEQRAAAHVVVQVLDDRPRQRQAVVRAGAASDFVEDHEAARRWRC